MKKNITLNISEIQELKSGRKSYEEIIKCRAVRQAERLGETGIVEEHYEDDGYFKEYTGKTITYENGLTIELSREGTPIFIKTENGETINYLNNFTGGNWASVYEEGDMTGNLLNHPQYGQSKEFFKQNPGSRISKLIPEEQREFDEFINNDGHTNTDIKKYVKGEMTYDEVMESAKKADEDMQRNIVIRDIYQPKYKSLLDYEATFRDIVSTNSFKNSPSFITAKIINDDGFLFEKEDMEALDLSKRITTNQSYRIDSSGADADYMTHTHGSGNNWLVLTLHDKGNPKNCGVDLQNSKSERGYRDYRTGNMTEAPFITAPGQKFRKEMVDYKNHIVYQVIH